MKRIAIMLILLTATTARAGWTGWPMYDATNYTFYGVDANLHAVSQLWYAASERLIVEPGDEVPGGPFFVWQDEGGTNAVVVTNITGKVLTNLTLVYSNFAHYVPITVISNRNIGYTEEYEIDDAGGSRTATTRLPYLGGMAQYGPGSDRHGYGILPFLDYALFANVDEAGGNVPIEQWVITNHSNAGNYDDWFAKQSGSGQRPDSFPTHNWATLAYYSNYGFATNLTTNIWGEVDGSSVTNSAQYGNRLNMAWFTSFPSNYVEWPLAETAFTNGVWTYNDIMTLGTNSYFLSDLGAYLMDPSILPSIIYRQGTTNTPKVQNVTVTGLVYKADIVTAYRLLESTSETIEVTGTNALTKQWYKVMAINPAGDGHEHDSYTVAYQNGLTMYSEPEFWTRLYSLALDERWKAMHAMIYSYVIPGQIGWTALGETNSWVWYGNGNTWTAAKDAMIASSPVGSVVDSAPCHYTEGRYISATNYDAYGYARESYYAITLGAVNTNFARRAEFYTAFSPVEGSWADQGDGYTEDEMYNVVDSTISITNRIISDTAIGSQERPATFPAAPTLNVDTFTGWIASSNNALIRWDVTSDDHPEFQFQTE